MICLKSRREIGMMRHAASKLKLVFQELLKKVQVGLTTYDLDEIAVKLIHKQGAEATFKGYRGYPASICTSLNCEVVHGIPSKKRKLIDGDLLSVDIGLTDEGYIADAARTVMVGRKNEDILKLIEVTKKSLFIAMSVMRPGKRVGDIGAAVQKHVESNGFSVIRDFVGHGVGRALHEDPQVPNYGKEGRGAKLEVGMVIAIEPMVAAGSWEVEMLENKWTVVTRDRKMAAHYEDTIAITEEETENLTGPQEFNGLD
ncbi:MAG: type I methionyl aminopeptidase [Omnitrophica bacterium RIFCSPLOWO2_12_FULL_44_17]|uniref:Methionine aminopeptidase n=1 Tax=Candidatus Danuiimicrobium aquiferis TaxID=1801832 RepID=A0A1G1L000_9BACT|nr:MAG: type I methionyl aminopeptidase [Omnitrophica bacterium RIFCSPHIGHO2_02_FULL_45_28]OGW98484.1 MAG: type I methionyl aminopeptidase [Omnitrophica bacterium RIFCSPLOWO2_12_FULL_44_17]OGX02931.1 MAG: type I methionyl aminopeptidase [Omnitrophica bacterium RIFCSPLOWO2_02_FULL_44_11]